MPWSTNAEARILVSSSLFLSGCLEALKKTEPSAENNAPENPETGLMQGMTEEHNKIRRPYNVPDLTWDEDLVDLSRLAQCAE